MRAALEACIAPHSRKEFLQEWWERAPLAVPRHDENRFAHLLTVEQFDSIVSCTNLRYPYFRLFRDGRLVPPAETLSTRQLGPDLEEGLADLNVIYDHFSEGGTIVLQALERLWPPLGAFCRDLALDLGFPTQAYAYLTPPTAHGSPPHYDTHEVFALQVGGTKKWRVWPNLKPLPMRVSANDYDPDSVKRFSENNQPILETVLRPGDTLYLPRGYVHQAVAAENGSLHISISIMVYRWVDLFESAVAAGLQRAARDMRFRESLPFGRSPGEPPSDSLKANSDDLVDALVDGLDLQQGIKLIRREFSDYSKPSFRGRLRDITELGSIEAGAVLYKRQDLVHTLSHDSDSVALTFGGQVEHFPIAWKDALDFVTRVESFEIDGIPGALSASDRLGLAKRLLSSGFCTTRSTSGEGR